MPVSSPSETYSREQNDKSSMKVCQWSVSFIAAPPTGPSIIAPVLGGVGRRNMRWMATGLLLVSGYIAAISAG